MILKIVGGAIAAVATVVVAVLVTGALLPREHTARGGRTLTMTADRVGSLIGDPRTYATWRKDVTIGDVRPVADGVHWRETSHGDAIDYVLTREGPLRWRSTILSEGLPYGGYWIIEVTPNGDGSAVRITEHGFVDNLAFRALGRFVFGFDSSLKAYLRDLEAAGQPA